MTAIILTENLDELPTSKVACFVAGLAQQHGVAYQRTGLDAWCEAVTRAAGDEVALDDTCNLLVELKRSGILNAGQMARLCVNHLREKRLSQA